MSLLATAKLQGISIKKGLTTFGLKTKLYIKAQKVALKAWKQMQALSAQHQLNIGSYTDFVTGSLKYSSKAASTTTFVGMV
jgi:hypothetical protein